MTDDTNNANNNPERSSSADTGQKRKDQSVLGALLGAIRNGFNALQAWLTPNKKQPIALQILFFILKIPVLLLLLLLSPVLLVVLLLVSLIAL